MPWNDVQHQASSVPHETVQGDRSVVAHELDPLPARRLGQRGPARTFVQLLRHRLDRIRSSTEARRRTTRIVFESRLVEFDYDKRGTQTEWKSKNAGENSAGRHITPRVLAQRAAPDPHRGEDNAGRRRDVTDVPLLLQPQRGAERVQGRAQQPAHDDQARSSRATRPRSTRPGLTAQDSRFGYDIGGQRGSAPYGREDRPGRRQLGGTIAS